MRGLGSSNPVRSASHSGFCAALRRPGGISRVLASFCTRKGTGETHTSNVSGPLDNRRVFRCS